MAGTFTHWMVVEDALAKFKNYPVRHEYFDVISAGAYKDYVLLGAVGPDLPYFSSLEQRIFQGANWADRMHYEGTGEFVKKGVINLQGLSGESFKFCLSWLCGYVTHLLADSMIHPVVNAIVGPYIFNRNDHMRCEMVQDSLIFEAVSQNELKNKEYEKFLKNFPVSNIGDFWAKTLKENHRNCNDEIDPEKWKENFFTLIWDAVNMRFGGYRKAEVIPQSEKDTFYYNAKLPGGRYGNFKTEAFDKTVIEVIKVWQKLFLDIQNNHPGNCANYIRNWNLDSGADMDEAYFW